MEVEARLEALERRQFRTEIVVMQLVFHGRGGVEPEVFDELVAEVQAQAEKHDDGEPG